MYFLQIKMLKNVQVHIIFNLNYVKGILVIRPLKKGIYVIIKLIKYSSCSYINSKVCVDVKMTF